MKRTKAFSLESDVIDVIEDYQKKYNLSSASAALERILLVELPKRVALDEIKELLSNVNIEKKVDKVNIEEVKEQEEEKNIFLANSLKRNMMNMLKE